MTKSSARGLRPITGDVVLRFYESLDTPVSLACWLMYKYDEHYQLVTHPIDPLSYSDAETFRLDYSAVKFLSKASFLRTGINTESVAKQTFIENEMFCRVSNDEIVEKLAVNMEVPLVEGSIHRFADVCQLITGKIARVLRDVPSSEVLDRCAFGPGSTTRVKGTKTSAYEKLQAALHTTREALDILPSFLREYPRFPREFSLVKGNDVTFVPKNAKTDRPIAIEPDLNIYIQLGIGDHIRRCLRRVGVDLQDQTRNQRLARQGSRFGNVATIDMSSASDLISQGAVMAVLPHPWYVLLDAVRSHYYKLDDKWYYYHKFSSMGNGFTFPLQSLLFWACAQVACDLVKADPHDVGVYGDDIIVPVSAYGALVSLLAQLGFKINSAKSFSSGPFRESCGKDYFDGVDCQPFFLKEEIDAREQVYKAHNAVSRLAGRFAYGEGRDVRFRNLCSFIRHAVPRKDRFAIPEGYGDGGFVSSFDEATPWPVRSKLGWEGWFYTTLTFRPSTYDMVDSDATLRFALMNAGSDRPCFGRATHRRKGTYRAQKVLANQWPALGTWF